MKSLRNLPNPALLQFHKACGGILFPLGVLAGLTVLVGRIKELKGEPVNEVAFGLSVAGLLLIALLGYLGYHRTHVEIGRRLALQPSAPADAPAAASGQQGRG